MFFKKKAKKIEIYQPVSGQIITLDQVDDPVFSGKFMGEGFAVQPKNGVIFSPVKGTVESIFPTKHAITLKTEAGLSLFVHIGIDTVSLDGEGLDVLVTVGQEVNENTQLVQVDLEVLASHHLQDVVIVVFPDVEREKIAITTGENEHSMLIGSVSV